jgi:hypothetical protein
VIRHYTDALTAGAIIIDHKGNSSENTGCDAGAQCGEYLARPRNGSPIAGAAREIEVTGIVEDLIASRAIVHLIFGPMVKRPA